MTNLSRRRARRAIEGEDQMGAITRSPAAQGAARHARSDAARVIIRREDAPPSTSGQRRRASPRRHIGGAEPADSGPARVRAAEWPIGVRPPRLWLLRGI